MTTEPCGAPELLCDEEFEAGPKLSDFYRKQ
jgi:hypothetical protein